MSKRLLVSTVTFGLVLLGGGSIGVSSATAASVGSRVSVMDNEFQPGRLRVQKGTRVKWVHNGSNPHTVTSNTGLFDESLDPGETFSRRFRKAGRFPYHCEIHSGMAGVIKVVA
jgi:plastocyanin